MERCNWNLKRTGKRRRLSYVFHKFEIVLPTSEKIGLRFCPFPEKPAGEFVEAAVSQPRIVGFCWKLVRNYVCASWVHVVIRNPLLVISNMADGAQTALDCISRWTLIVLRDGAFYRSISRRLTGVQQTASSCSDCTLADQLLSKAEYGESFRDHSVDIALCISIVMAYISMLIILC